MQLNLISQELKNEVKLKHAYNLIKTAGLILVLLVLISTISLLLAKYFLQESFNQIVAETTLITKNSQSYNDRVREINQQLNAVSGIQNDFFPWSFLIEDMASNTPSDVAFSSLRINNADKTVKISGLAQLRSDLLKLNDYLQNSDDFNNVNFPLQNILEESNINFDIKAEINTDLSDLITKYAKNR